MVIAIIVLFVPGMPIHGSGPLGENYSLMQSTRRIQETNSLGVTFVLNVTNASPLKLNYQFAWTVRDPSGTLHNVNTQVNNAPTTFTTSVNYPASFGTSITYVGNYSLTVSQTMPPPTTLANATWFQVGLTNSISYQRTQPVSLTAQGYQNGESVNINVTSKAGTAPGFPLTTLAPSGVVSFTWPSIPANIPLGNYTVTLRGSTTKAILDTQSFQINAASMTIPQLYITQNSLERSQTEGFRFTATYPNTTQARTGSAIIRIIEADGLTEHDITATYRATLGAFQGFYQIPLSGNIGAWVASIDIGGYNDGYGNTGPISGVVHGFAVSPAILTIVVGTDNYNYTTGKVVAIYAKIITPGGANFTSGTVNATSYFSTQQVRGPIQLSYDQSRGRWVGSYIINATDPSGVWIVRVNATDPYGNSGDGSTSILVTNPPMQPPQTLTSNYLLMLVIGLSAALGILGSWVAIRRGRVARKVLRVDLEAVHAEAQKVENDAFFKKVQDQLKDMRKGESDQK